MKPLNFNQSFRHCADRGDFTDSFRLAVARALDKNEQPGSMPPDGEAAPANDLFLPTLTPAKETDARQHCSSH